MKAKLKRGFSAHETALWVSGEDVEVFPEGTTGQLTKDEHGDREFAPDGYDGFAFYIEHDDVSVWSFDGKTWAYRPQSELFEAGNQWYTIEYYEKEFQRRLL